MGKRLKREDNRKKITQERLSQKLIYSRKGLIEEKPNRGID